jgi:predicted dehydrogenase
MFDLESEQCFEKWEDLLCGEKIADVAIIATQDNGHYNPAMKAIELGYNLLLEKPVAQTAKECIDIANAARDKGVKVLVCHVLRYTPFYKTVKKIIMDGTIGDIQSVIQVEAVGIRHQSHSYVRGDWSKVEESTPMLLAKSCHDMDIIQWLVDKPCKKVSSFGALTYFKPENAP